MGLFNVQVWQLALAGLSIEHVHQVPAGSSLAPPRVSGIYISIELPERRQIGRLRTQPLDKFLIITITPSPSPIESNVVDVVKQH
jgi:hypothetical protein